MKNDLATEITGRVRRSLDGLLANRVWRWLPSLPALGQRLYTRYSDWVDGLLSRFYLPLASALLFSRSSNLQLSPLSYAWFHRKWIDRRKRSRPFRRQSVSGKDEDRQMPAVPEYFFEEDADEDIMNQLQSTQSEPAENIILNLPTLRTQPTGNTESTRAEKLAKKIALRFELLSDKGSYTPWHTPFEATDMPYYPELVTDNSLLDRGTAIIAGQRSGHLDETFSPSSSVESSPRSLNPVSGQHIGTVLMPVPGRFSLMERTPTQAVSPVVLSPEGTNFGFEPSGAPPVAPSGSPASEARIASLSHLSEAPSTMSTNILARKAFLRLQRLFGTPLVASSTNLMREALAASPSYLFEPQQVASGTVLAGKELAASPSYLFEPPPVASDAVLAGKAGATHVSLPEESPLFRRDEIPDMTSVDGRYFGSLFPQPPLGKTWGSHQASSLHWSAGHIPPSLTGEAISQEMGEPVKAVASTMKSSSFGGYNRSTKVGLALAPIGRQRENISAATSSAVSGGQERASEAAGETMAALDPEALASEVYSILKRRLIVEKERTTSVA